MKKRIGSIEQFTESSKHTARTADYHANSLVSVKVDCVLPFESRFLASEDLRFVTRWVVWAVLALSLDGAAAGLTMESVDRIGTLLFLESPTIASIAPSVGKSE